MSLNVIDGLAYKRIEINSLDGLIDLVSDYEGKDFNSKKKLSQICEEVGLYDTAALFDERTLYLYKLYLNYKYSPHSVPFGLFQDVVVILNQYEQRLI